MSAASYAALLGAYLLGAVPSSYLVARWMGGIDLRTVGSRNLGATNLYRQLGWKAAIPAGLFDLLKGTVPALLAGRMTGAPEWWPLAVGLSAVLGHVYSPFVGFKGGKGVATAAGVFLAVAPLSIGVALVVWVGLLWGTGYMSVASMVAAMSFAVATPLFYSGRPTLAIVGSLMCGFIVFTHRTNIMRLLNGTESRFNTRKRGGG